jgi:hypothetical protein
VTVQTIYNWWNQHLIDTGRKAGDTTTESTELTAAHRRIIELEIELAATRHANELLKSVVSPKKAIRGRRGDGRRRSPGGGLRPGVFGVELGVYLWRKPPPSNRAIRHAWLTDQIIDIHARRVGSMEPNGSTPS